MGTGASKTRKKNKVRQNVLVVGSLQANAKRLSRSTELAVAEPVKEEETKPISLVDAYEVNDSLLFKGGTSDQFVPYFKAWLVRVNSFIFYIFTLSYLTCSVFDKLGEDS